jgi:hypothetical protein
VVSCFSTNVAKLRDLTAEHKKLENCQFVSFVTRIELKFSIYLTLLNDIELSKDDRSYENATLKITEPFSYLSTREEKSHKNELSPDSRNPYPHKRLYFPA